MKTVVCDGCGEQVIAESINEDFPDSGLVIPFRMLGFYGGFTDNNPWDEMMPEEFFKICHACVIKMLDAIPGLAQKIFERYGSTLHSTINADGTPCCRHCYIPN